MELTTYLPKLRRASTPQGDMYETDNYDSPKKSFNKVRFDKEISKSRNLKKIPYFTTTSKYSQLPEHSKLHVDIPRITKCVFTQLSDYVSDFKDKSPMFGYPCMQFSPIQKSNSSNWQKITQTIIDPNFK